MDAHDQELLAAARAAWERAYAPYSRYAVGAALRGKSGRIYPGANVENAVYPLTICAERTAVVTAVSSGEREFTAIAVVTANGGTPCGACRQVLVEFAPGLRIIVADLDGHATVYALSELLPHSFDASKLP
ncbi:MAG: cytidine deaminase [Chloroflexi bacterium]|nr:cytidine deaminase [Chloroflexota bacterium]